MTRLPVLARPRVRGDCANGPRPCPWIGCRHHLADVRVDVDGDLLMHGQHSRLELNAPPSVVDAFIESAADAVAAMRESCVLDVADRSPDGAALQEIGDAFDLTRERVRQIEKSARQHLHPRARLRGLR